MPRKKRTKKHLNGTRVTVTKSTLNRLVSLGASHHATLVKLRKSAKVAPAKRRKKASKKKARKKKGTRRRRRATK
jgi:ABC-type Fe3+-hydroxamate transport system substrate-binding protein